MFLVAHGITSDGLHVMNPLKGLWVLHCNVTKLSGGLTW